MKSFDKVLIKYDIKTEKMRIHQKSIKVSIVAFIISLYYAKLFSILIAIFAYFFCSFIIYGPKRKQLKKIEKKLSNQNQ